MNTQIFRRFFYAVMLAAPLFFTQAFAQEIPPPPPPGLPAGSSGSTENEIITPTGVPERTLVLFVDGISPADRPITRDRKPGEAITLVADGAYNTNCAYASGCLNNLPLENFIWVASDTVADPMNPDKQIPDQCDPSNKDIDWLKQSNFEVNSYGVTFHVPDGSGTITIKPVLKSNPRLPVEAMTINVSQDFKFPNQVNPDPADYSGDNFSYEQGLAGLGNFVDVGGESYFQPVTDDDPQWAPYQNGYFDWVDPGDDVASDPGGITWNGLDLWSEYTDNHGVWRYHETYGWIWRPFSYDQNLYNSAPVTFFLDGDNIGWYPYCPGYAYDLGYNEGFVDGYYDNYSYMANYGTYFNYSNGFYKPGFRALPYGRFFSPNVRNYLLGSGVDGIWNNAFKNNWIYRYPGAASAVKARAWLEDRAQGKFPIGFTGAKKIGGTTFRYPRPLDGAGYKEARESALSKAKLYNPKLRMPLGARMDKKGTLVRPTTDNRGIVDRPRIPLVGGTAAVLAPRTKIPLHVNPANPVYQPRAVEVFRQPINRLPERHPGGIAPVAQNTTIPSHYDHPVVNPTEEGHPINTANGGPRVENHLPQVARTVHPVETGEPYRGNPVSEPARSVAGERPAPSERPISGERDTFRPFQPNRENGENANRFTPRPAPTNSRPYSPSAPSFTPSYPQRTTPSERPSYSRSVTPSYTPRQERSAPSYTPSYRPSTPSYTPQRTAPSYAAPARSYSAPAAPSYSRSAGGGGGGGGAVHSSGGRHR